MSRDTGASVYNSHTVYAYKPGFSFVMADSSVMDLCDFKRLHVVVCSRDSHMGSFQCQREYKTVASKRNTSACKACGVGIRNRRVRRHSA